MAAAAACDSTAPAAGLRVGDVYDLRATYLVSYDCGAPYATPPDSIICNATEGLVPVWAETLDAVVRLELYTPDRVCDFDSPCRDLATGVFEATASGELRVCILPAGTATPSCQGVPLEPRAAVRLNLTTCPGLTVCADRTGLTYWVAVILGTVSGSYTLWGLQEDAGASGTLVHVEVFSPDPRTLTVGE